MRKLGLLPLLSILGAAACGQPVDAPAGGNPPDQAASPAPANTVEPAILASSLAGAWRVAAIDGKTLDEPHGLALTGDGERLWWEPRCAGMARIYRIAGRSISFRSLHGPRPPGTPTPPVCAIGLPSRLDEVFRILDAATTVERTEQNGVRISGGGHSVTLFLQ